MIVKRALRELAPIRPTNLYFPRLQCPTLQTARCAACAPTGTVSSARHRATPGTSLIPSIVSPPEWRLSAWLACLR